MIKGLGLLCLVFGLSGCSNIQLSPTMPFVKLTMPPAFSIAGTANQPAESKKPENADMAQLKAAYQGELTALKEAYAEQQEAIKLMEADILMLSSPDYLPPPATPSKKRRRRAKLASTASGSQQNRTVKPDSTCPYLLRDLSRPNSNIIYCRPQ